MALELCDQADRLSEAAFDRGPAVSVKADGTPVTDADTAIEEMIRRTLAERFPEDAVIGEEYGSDGDSPRAWIIDPIDGTKNFAGGIPLWATLLGLRVDGEFVLGVMSLPGIGQRFWAARGAGAFHNGRAIAVNGTARMEDAMVLFGDVEAILGTPEEGPFLRVVSGARRSRGFGDSWGYGLIAAGHAEAMIEPALMIWDVAAPAAIVEIAGGTITQFDGTPLAHGGSALATNGVLHQSYIEALRPGGVST
jgi:histidinol-phosphatase